MDDPITLGQRLDVLITQAEERLDVLHNIDEALGEVDLNLLSYVGFYRRVRELMKRAR